MGSDYPWQCDGSTPCANWVFRIRRPVSLIRAVIRGLGVNMAEGFIEFPMPANTNAAAQSESCALVRLHVSLFTAPHDAADCSAGCLHWHCLWCSDI